MSRGNLSRTWANLGAEKAPKWSPKASQDGAKKEKNNEVKLREFKRGFREAQKRKPKNCTKAGWIPPRPSGEERGDCCAVFGVVVFVLDCILLCFVVLCCAVVLSFGKLVDCCLFWGCLGSILGRFGRS